MAADTVIGLLDSSVVPRLCQGRCSIRLRSSRPFPAAGRLARGGRRLRLRLAATWPWAAQLTAAITRLQAFAPRLTSPNRP